MRERSKERPGYNSLTRRGVLIFPLRPSIIVAAGVSAGSSVEVRRSAVSAAFGAQPGPVLDNDAFLGINLVSGKSRQTHRSESPIMSPGIWYLGS